MADAILRVDLQVTGITSRGVQVVTPGSDWAFWLPLGGHVQWSPWWPPQMWGEDAQGYAVRCPNVG